MSSKYDFVVHRRDGDSVGYMCAWGIADGSPLKLVSQPPDLPISTSTGLSSAGGEFTARDAAPPYPIEISDWRGGAGQKSYDNKDALDSAFLTSRAINVTEEGEFGIGPRVFTITDSTILNVAGFALGTFWASFTPAVADPRNSLRFLMRADTTDDGITWLEADDDDTMQLTPYANLTDRTLAYTRNAAVGDYLLGLDTGEIVTITEITDGEATVTRGAFDTTAVEHATGEQWLLLHWQPVTFASTDPAQKVSAIATDGEYVYAAFHTPGTDNGSVWRGKPNSTDWTSWSSTNNIVNLVSCAGYIYGAQENYVSSTPDRTTVGYFTSAGVFTPISLYGSMTPQMSSAGLTSIGNYVYWGTTDNSKSSIYRIQHTSENVFELVAHMPDGFVLQDLLGHLGSLYAAGYIDTVATSANDTDLQRYEGALYIVGADNTIARLFRIKDNTDSRMRGLAPVGPHILCLTNENVYLYDTTTGGYSHYCQVPTNTISGATPDLDPLSANGFVDRLEAYGQMDAIVYGDGVGEHISLGLDEPENQDWLASSEASSADFDSSGVTGNYPYCYDQWECAAGKYHRVALTAGTTPAAAVDLPTTGGTLEWTVSYLKSQAGTVVVGMDDKEVRVKMQGMISGGVVTKHVFSLGYTSDATCDIDEYEYLTAASLDPGTHTCRLLFDASGARLYVNDILSASVAYNQLRDAQVANSIRWSVGWPNDARTDTYRERIRWHYMAYLPGAVYAPEYEGGALVTTSMKNIASAQGMAIVPVPGSSWAMIDPQEQVEYGHLTTSESAFHMGGVDKYFVSVVVEHSTIQTGQQLRVYPFVDGEQQATGEGVANAVSTTTVVGKKGKSIYVRVRLDDDSPTRLYAERLRVYRITAKFFPVNSPHVWEVQLNCRKDVQCRNHKMWDYDPEYAIRHAFAASDAGEVVDVENNFTNLGEHETQPMRIESVRLEMAPSDRNSTYDGLVGTLIAKLRRVDG